MPAIFFQWTLTKFGIIEGLANSNESDCFVVMFSISKCVACAAVAVRARSTAVFGDNEGLVSVILETDQEGNEWQIICLTDHNNRMLNAVFVLCWSTKTLCVCWYICTVTLQTLRKFFAAERRNYTGNYIIFYFNTRNVHLFLFRTMTNKCTIISQIIILFLHMSTQLCHPR